jgi:hypothetical protein
MNASRRKLVPFNLPDQRMSAWGRKPSFIHVGSDKNPEYVIPKNENGDWLPSSARTDVNFAPHVHNWAMKLGSITS